MSDANDVTATPPREVEEYTYRKLIRPSLVRTGLRPAAEPKDDARDEIRTEAHNYTAARPEPGNEIRSDPRANQRPRGEARQPSFPDEQPLTPDRGYAEARGTAIQQGRNLEPGNGRRPPVPAGAVARSRPERNDGFGGNGNPGRNHQKRAPRGENFIAKKVPPPEQTHAESFYYQKQMQAKTVVIAVMQDGEELEGIIEWYDKNCIKMNRIDEPNVVVYKRNIKYLFKADDAEGE